MPSQAKSQQPIPINIFGNGLVALALTLFLDRQGITATLESDYNNYTVPDWLYNRPLALSRGSIQLLSRVLDLRNLSTFETIDISMTGRRGHSLIRASDIGQPILGGVIRYGNLHEQLKRRVLQREKKEETTAKNPLSFADVFKKNNSNELAQENQSQYNNISNAIGASFQKEEHNSHAAIAQNDITSTIRIDTSKRPEFRNKTESYHQVAVSTEITVSKPQPKTTFECFTPDGPLALLPLLEPNRYGVVWCSRPKQKLHELSDKDFISALTRTIGDRLGSLSIESERSCVPLLGSRYDDPCYPYHAVIADAAQRLHPVAGQGLNLGLRDAFVLAQNLGNAQSEGVELQRIIQEFPQKRFLDRRFVQGFTNQLAYRFTQKNFRPIASLLLDIFESVAPIKKLLTQHLMFGLRYIG